MNVYRAIQIGIPCLALAADNQVVTPFQQVGSALALPMRQEGTSRIGVDVAGGDEGYLAVWMEVQPDGATDIYGARIDPDGILLDRDSLVISDAAGDQVFPAVAAHPSGHLVVWADLRSEAATSVDVYAARVSNDGEVLDPEGLLIHASPGPQFLLDVAFNGDGFFIVWQDGDGLMTGGGDASIRGTAVTLDGLVESPEGILITNDFLDQTRPAIASNGSDYLVVWNDIGSGVTWDVRGCRVRADGTVVDREGIAIATRPENDENFPTVGSDGEHYLVLWEDAAGETIRVHGRRISAAGTPLDSAPTVLGPGEGASLVPSLASVQGHYVVVLQEGIGYSFGDEAADLVMARVAGNGTFLDPTPHSVVSSPASEEMAATASVGHRVLVVYQTGDENGRFRLEARLLEPSFPRILPSVAIEDPDGRLAAFHGDIERLVLAALRDWGRYLRPPAGVIPALEIRVRFESLGLTVAYAASEAGVTVEADQGFLVYEEGMAYEIRTGSDPNGSEPDATITLNSGFVYDAYWYDPNPANRSGRVPKGAGRFDFYSVVLHELAHALGVFGNADRNGNPDGRFISKYDRLVAREAGHLFFVGETAMALYGGPVPLTIGNYLHVGNSAGPGARLAPDLMHSPTDCALGGRCFISGLDLAILKDTGLPVDGIPAPPAITEVSRQADGSIVLEWTGANYDVRVLSSPRLTGRNWRPVSGFLVGTRAVLDPSPGDQRGFFRLELVGVSTRHSELE